MSSRNDRVRQTQVCSAVTRSELFQVYTGTKDKLSELMTRGMFHTLKRGEVERGREGGRGERQGKQRGREREGGRQH